VEKGLVDRNQLGSRGTEKTSFAWQFEIKSDNLERWLGYVNVSSIMK
jgi:hypothetical protein